MPGVRLIGGCPQSFLEFGIPMPRMFQPLAFRESRHHDGGTVKNVLIITAAFIILSVFDGVAQAQKRGSLYGTVVVLDPGHGGVDPGSSGISDDMRVVEDEYTYDIALRVARMVRQRQGLVFTTIKDRTGLRDWPANRVFSDARTERFALDNSVVRAGTAGLNKRLAYGNQISRRYPRHRQVWISIHFDVVGRIRSIAGVRIIAPDIELSIAKALAKSFDNAQRLRSDNPVVANGDKDFGLRRLYVLTAANSIRQRVLIELGNFNNSVDVWRIRSFEVREAYARAIVQALED